MDFISNQRKYPDERIIVEVLSRDDLGRVLEAKLPGHSIDKDEMDSIMMEHEGLAFTLFSGEIPLEVMLWHCRCSCD